ncbi:YHS domain-containing (seleno)protein [Litorivicinus lipolyticus]|uniref:YHS domain-containing (seleno)protein n=1 Tax=Litorivicinus lipolyticus TaxID=418701 RepID=UPI003B593E99
MKTIAMTMLVTVSTLAAAATDPVYTSRFSNNALGGYDAVSYHAGSPPQRGDTAFSHDYMGATWLFANAANRMAFAASPAQYAPQYGGYCAWAAAQGYTASGDPMQYSVVDGRLFLNYNASVKRNWEADIPGFIKAADANWPGLLN